MKKQIQMIKTRFLLLACLIIIGCSDNIGEVAFTDRDYNIVNYHENSGLVCIYRPNHEKYEIIYENIDGKQCRSIVVNDIKITPKSNQIFLILGNGKSFLLDKFKLNKKDISAINKFANEVNSKSIYERNKHFTEPLKKVFGNQFQVEINKLIKKHYHTDN
jgi:hypothetical protein